MTSVAVFVERDDDVFDLWLNGRIQDYDIRRPDMADAVHRARFDKDVSIYVEDSHGRRLRWTGRR